jgi:hypothetical protein
VGTRILIERDLNELKMKTWIFPHYRMIYGTDREGNSVGK